MPEQVQCPSCSAALRVPDTLLGKNVKCPKCQTTFLAELEELDKPEGVVREREQSAARRRRPSPPQEEELEEVPEEEDEDYPQRRRGRRGRRSGRAAAAVAGPATSLMVISGIAIGLSILSLLYNILMGGVSASFLSQQNAAMKSPSPAPKGFGMQPIQPAPAPAQPPLSPKVMLLIQLFAGIVGNIIALVYWSVVFVGAMKMKSLSSYAFAMTSCIMSMLPCSCCCVLGLPFGIWGLVALNKPEVKDAFS